MEDLGAVRPVVHHENLELPFVTNHKLLEAVREEMPRLLVATVADVGHPQLTFEPASDSVVDTLWFSPVGLDSLEPVTLMSPESLSPLLHGSDGPDWSDNSHGGYVV